MSKFQHIDPTYLATMSGGDRAMQQTLLEMLFTELEQETANMEHLIAATNWEELVAASHKMKNTLPYIGNPHLTHLNEALHNSAKAKQPSKESMTNLMKQFKSHLPSILKELKTLHAKLN